MSGRNGSLTEGPLKVRVDALAEDVHQLRLDIASLAVKIDSTSRPNWQAWGVALTAAGIIGALAYWPIRESTVNNAGALSELSRNVVFIRRYDSEQKAQNEKTAEVVAQLRDHTRRLVAQQAELATLSERSQRNTATLLRVEEKVERLSTAGAENTQALKELRERLGAISLRLAQYIRDAFRKGP